MWQGHTCRKDRNPRPICMWLDLSESFGHAGSNVTGLQRHHPEHVASESSISSAASRVLWPGKVVLRSETRLALVRCRELLIDRMQLAETRD